MTTARQSESNIYSAKVVVMRDSSGKAIINAIFSAGFPVNVQHSLMNSLESYSIKGETAVFLAQQESDLVEKIKSASSGSIKAVVVMPAGKFFDKNVNLLRATEKRVLLIGEQLKPASIIIDELKAKERAACSERQKIRTHLVGQSSYFQSRLFHNQREKQHHQKPVTLGFGKGYR